VEDNLIRERAEESLCPAQPASECAGTLWPLQKVRCASRPLCPVGHDLAHVGGQGSALMIFSIAAIGGYVVDQRLRLSRRVGPDPAYRDVCAIRFREMLASGDTNRDVHSAKIQQLLKLLYMI
jgi:hypothetical protein